MKALSYLAVLGQGLVFAYCAFALIATAGVGLASTSESFIVVFALLASGLGIWLHFKSVAFFGRGARHDAA